MAQNVFDYQTLFAQELPEARNIWGSRRGKYDFAIAYPDPASIPLPELAEAAKEALLAEGRDLAFYLSTQGYAPLRDFVAAKLNRFSGMKVTADDLMLTGGGGQAIHIVLELLLNPGDIALTEDFTYGGALAQLRRFHADVRGVACDADGLLPDALERAMQQAQVSGKRLKLIYLMPNFQNPQGWTMPLERRQAVVALAQKYNVPILEDDCYADLRYDGEHLPSLHALDESGLVSYVGSFSKTIAPGMRCGFMAAPRPLLERAIYTKTGGPVPLFVTFALHRYVRDHFLSHVEVINDIQRQRRDAMLAGLAEHFGDGATWSQPQGGLSIWVKFPADRDVNALRERVLQQYDVGYVSGLGFDPQRSAGKNCLRLTFGFNTPSEISEGIALLATAFRREGVL